MRLPGTFLNQSSDTKIKVKIGQNLEIKSTAKGLSNLLHSDSVCCLSIAIIFMAIYFFKGQIFKLFGPLELQMQ